MFTYRDIATLSRIELLKASQDAKVYWKFLWELKKLWTGFGDTAQHITNQYLDTTKDAKLFRILSEGIDLSELKIDVITAELERIDDYQFNINLRLADGTALLSARQIGDMTDV